MAGPVPAALLALLRRVVAGSLKGSSALGGSIEGVDVHLEFDGYEAFVKKLDSFARKQAPAAAANALNSSATMVTSRVQKILAEKEHKTRKQMRKICYKGFRADARVMRLAAEVKVRIPGQKIRYVSLSKPFTATMPSGYRGKFGRAIGHIPSPKGQQSRRWTKGRSRKSSPNLPIKKFVGRRAGHLGQRRQLTLERAGRVVMREYFPGELIKQLNRRIAKAKARR